MKTYAAFSVVRLDGKERDIDHTINARTIEEAEAISDALGWYFIGEVDALLTAATDLGLEEVVAMHERGQSTLH